MGYLGKALLGAGIGVVAIAAAPFTGGGSLLGGASLVASLAGAGALAGTAGVLGAASGAAAQKFEDKQKEKTVKTAEEYAFKDGMNEGKAVTVEQIKKFTDFCMATTALSFYIARCDGTIDEAEMLELQFDLDAINKNQDLPNEIKNELKVISMNETITFDEVKVYLDQVSIATLKELEKDIDEIIMANGVIEVGEAAAKDEFLSYLRSREDGEIIHE